ncbi:MAG: hypothetical protein P8X58_03795 [Syntrophobacterales bacterium]
MVAWLATLAFMTTALAALPPGAIEKLKADAQEELKIKILDVEKTGKDPQLKVTFTAEVLEVKRSATGLKPGEKITIRSYHWTKAFAGPPNPPILAKGWIGLAYLNKAKGKAHGSGKTYSLAAYGDSFEKSS